MKTDMSRQMLGATAILFLYRQNDELGTLILFSHA
jgi:hypothetical protein